MIFTIMIFTVWRPLEKSSKTWVLSNRICWIKRYRLEFMKPFIWMLYNWSSIFTSIKYKFFILYGSNWFTLTISLITKLKFYTFWKNFLQWKTWGNYLKLLFLKFIAKHWFMESLKSFTRSAKDLCFQLNLFIANKNWHIILLFVRSILKRKKQYKGPKSQALRFFWHLPNSSVKCLFSITWIVI